MNCVSPIITKTVDWELKTNYLPTVNNYALPQIFYYLRTNPSSLNKKMNIHMYIISLSLRIYCEMQSSSTGLRSMQSTKHVGWCQRWPDIEKHKSIICFKCQSLLNQILTTVTIVKT